MKLFSKLFRKKEANNECIICLEKINSKQNLECCKQNVHQSCLSKWILTTNNCPHCRNNNPIIINNKFNLFGKIKKGVKKICSFLKKYWKKILTSIGLLYFLSNIGLCIYVAILGANPLYFLLMLILLLVGNAILGGILFVIGAFFWYIIYG